ncbi:MAG: Fic family protein [Gemmatimonadetes bacterium]|nr:Fic family protein [Gemmatimonadota bacterium]
MNNVLDALSALEADAGVKERMARWIAESRSLGIDIRNLNNYHVRLFERLADLEAAIAEWHERREGVKSADNERLWRKLRLEWNYNSNHIEGNTLTYHETELLLIYGRTAGGHPMRDYEEMKAHDVAIDYTRSLAGEEQVIGESDIRQLNKIILKEPFLKYAETPDGQPTQKRIVPGQYKTQPNHVRTATGELHRFAEPEETPPLMEEWTRDFRRDLERSAYPLPLFLAESHWSFIHIHPFDDGNGRTARLLSNYALLRNNLPPIVIKSEDRDRYISGLQNADIGRILPLAEFMLENIQWSLQLGIRAAKGESIQEPGDIDKEIDLFVRGKRGSAVEASDIEVLDSVFSFSVRPTLDKLEKALEPLRQLFNDSHWGSYLKTAHNQVQSMTLFDNEHWESTKQSHVARPGFKLQDQQQVEFRRKLRLLYYVGSGTEGFSVNLFVVWKLGREGFSFDVSIDKQLLASVSQSIPYSELDVHRLEVEHTVDSICKSMINEIEHRSQRPKRE